MQTKTKKFSSNLEDLMAECFYNPVHSKRIKIGIIKGKICRISEW